MYGGIYCFLCQDYIYDKDMETIAKEEQRKAWKLQGGSCLDFPAPLLPCPAFLTPIRVKFTKRKTSYLGRDRVGRQGRYGSSWSFSICWKVNTLSPSPHRQPCLPPVGSSLLQALRGNLGFRLPSGADAHQSHSLP